VKVRGGSLCPAAGAVDEVQRSVSSLLCSGRDLGTADVGGSGFGFTNCHVL